MRRLVALVLGWCRRETDIPEFVRRTPADDPAMVAARRALGIEAPLLTVDADDVAEAQKFALAAEVGVAERAADPSKWRWTS